MDHVPLDPDRRYSNLYLSLTSGLNHFHSRLLPVNFRRNLNSPLSLCGPRIFDT